MATPFDSLDKAFNTNSSIERKNDGSSIVPELIEAEVGDLDKDYNYVRSHLYSLMDKGREAIDNLYEFAQECENPARTYEVLFQGIKNIADISDKLPELQKKMRDMDSSKSSSPTSVTNNTVFFGPTSELSKLIKEGIINNIEDLETL